ADVLGRLYRDGRERREATGAPLPGAIAGAERAALEAELADAFGQRGAARLVRTYGGLSERMLRAARERPELARPVGPGAELLVVELVHALETEWAESLVDVLQRRTMLGLGADFGSAEAPLAAAALVELGL